MVETSSDVALFTPVPYEHLISGTEKCLETGFVAFGTDAVIVLSEINLIADDKNPVGILFYASHVPGGASPNATFTATFVGYEGAVAGKAKPGWAQHRPTSTGGDKAWKSFYLVKDLIPLVTPVPIVSLKKRRGRSKFQKGFIPQGPIIIDTPFK